MDEQAFQSLYRQTSRPLWAYVSRVLGSTVADDIVQEAYLRLLRSKPAATDPRALRALLYRIASNLIVDHWRRESRERASAEENPVASSAPPGDATIRLDLERVFRQLRPQERMMLWLAYAEGSDHREIAQAVGVKERSVRVLLFRARARLAALLRASGFRGSAS